MLAKIPHRLVYKITLFSMLVIGLTFGNQLQALEEYCDPVECHPEECQENIPCNSNCASSFWDSKCALILGPALVGAAVGAGIAAAVNDGHRGHRGHRGATGASGDAFITDPGEALVFNFDAFSAIALPTGPITVIPFVTQPNGTTIEGAAVSVSVATGFAPPPITINNPQFGTYVVGVQVSTVSLNGLEGTRLVGHIEVNASRNGSVTALTLPFPMAFSTGAGVETQIETTYVYDPDNIP